MTSTKSEVRVSTAYVLPATAETFDEDGYLAANPDVKAAVRAGTVKSGRAHFETIGFGEKRSVWKPANIKVAKAAKSRLILESLIDRSHVDRVAADGLIDCLPPDIAAAAGVVETEAVSSNNYDQWILDYISSHPDRWILDAGSGLRSTYYDNVVNLEIVPYDTTDVLGVGEVLPFRDDVFDLVVSVAVLEHVRDPFRCASELYRVLKPGGELYIAVPFLQPFHGYPNHYYNMTSSGVRNLFREPLTDVEQTVPHYLGPLWVASWFFALWSMGLPEESRESLKKVTVAEFIDATVDYYDKPWVRDLNPITANTIASGTVLQATKPANGPAADASGTER
jgi:SAM-dependent methyltransferase